MPDDTSRDDALDDRTGTNAFRTLVALAVLVLLVGGASAYVLDRGSTGPAPATGTATPATDAAGADAPATTADGTARSNGAQSGGAEQSPPTDASPSDPAATSAPATATPEPRPEFVYWTADIRPCGTLCREVAVAIRNVGTAPARSVHVAVTLTTQGTFGQNTLWTGETAIERLPVNETHRETRTIEVARSKLLPLKANGCTVTAHVTIESATRTQSFEETKQLDCSV
jgi:hypothetical protein